MNAFDVLKARGFVQLASDDAAIYEMLKTPTTVYTGFDPTGPSLTIGHMVPVMQLVHLQRGGHQPIVLCGGGTAMIGDPSDKTSARPILTREKINDNLASQKQQLMRFLDFSDDRALVLNNADWLCELGYIEFLRDIGRHFSVNQMLSADIYRRRLENDLPLSFLEFNYQLLQGYDFLHLYREHNCTMQAAGQDQWTNCLAGMDLVRKLEDADVHVLCTPLLTTASGEKMGKTAGQAVYLSAELTPVFDFYQYWINVDDRDVEKCLKFFTLLDLDRIAELAALEGAEIREAKRVLAFEVTKLVHGEEAAAESEEAAKALFYGGAGSADAAPTSRLPQARLGDSPSIVDMLVETDLCRSRGEARRLVQQGGAYVNDERVDDVDRTLSPDDVRDGEILLRAGKKKYHRLVVGD